MAAGRLPLLLLPGTLCDGRVFAPLVAGLGPKFDCAVFGTGDHDSVGAVAEALLQRAPQRFALAGFSLGGMVALEVAARAPGRVAGLALLCAKATPTPDAQKPERLAWLEAARREGLETVVTQALPRWLHPLHLHDAALRQVIVDMALTAGVAVLARQVRANNGRPDNTGLLPRLAVPTLVLFGGSDLLCTPQEARDMAAAIPGATLVEIEGAGHFAPLEQPEAVATAVRAWLVPIEAD